MVKSKTFTGYLVFNLKTGEARLNKKKPTNVGVFDFPVKYSINVEMPDRPDVEIKGKIVIPPMKAGEMILEHL